VRFNKPDALERLRTARVARLATVSADGRPHLVPVTFALDEDTVVIAIDHKPKSTRNLKRLQNIAATGRVSLLADEYNEDWSQLWWVRVDGDAEVSDVPSPALAAKYPQYRENPPEGPWIRINITAVTGWAGQT
jgi:PPOX class probable F420-dependent enzyme